jgi:hypothetical protein
MLLFALGTLAIYLPVRHYTFVLFDDASYVTDNPIVKTFCCKSQTI